MRWWIGELVDWRAQSIDGCFPPDWPKTLLKIGGPSRTAEYKTKSP
jgi:hypothetical protein